MEKIIVFALRVAILLFYFTFIALAFFESIINNELCSAAIIKCARAAASGILFGIAVIFKLWHHGNKNNFSAHPQIRVKLEVNPSFMFAFKI